LTLHTQGQSPKAVTFQNAYMTTLFDQSNGLLKEFYVEQEWKSKVQLKGHRIFFIKKIKKLFFIAYFQPISLDSQEILTT